LHTELCLCCSWLCYQSNAGCHDCNHSNLYRLGIFIWKKYSNNYGNSHTDIVDNLNHDDLGFKLYNLHNRHSNRYCTRSSNQRYNLDNDNDPTQRIRNIMPNWLLCMFGGLPGRMLPNRTKLRDNFLSCDKFNHNRLLRSHDCIACGNSSDTDFTCGALCNRLGDLRSYHRRKLLSQWMAMRDC